MPMHIDYRTVNQVEETRCQRNGKPYFVGHAGKMVQRNHYTCPCGKGGNDFCALGSVDARNTRAASVAERNAKRIENTEAKKTKVLTVADADIQRRTLEGAKLYALADKSDPFALGRAMTHVRMGIARPRQDGFDGTYNAEATVEKRLTATGEEYLATVYKNTVRP